MNVWTICEGEPLPLEGCKGRIMRAGIISRMLADRGHNTTWFTSEFSHPEKRRVRNGPVSEYLAENYEIYLLHPNTIYKKHVSFARLKYYKELSLAFAREAKKRKKPDVIYCSLPSIDFAHEAIKYGSRHGVPVAIDVRDFWPDVFLTVIPGALAGLGKIAVRGMDKKVRYIMESASMVTSVCNAGINWCKQKGRRLGAFDGVLYQGYPKTDYDPKSPDDAAADLFWDRQSILAEQNIICFVGNIGRIFDIAPIAQAAEILTGKGARYKFVFCGGGDFVEQYKSKYEGRDMTFPGFINAPQIHALMRRSIAGIIPYDKKILPEGIVNKSIEYMSGGLPVVSSVNGDLEELLAQNGAGLTYNTGDELAAHLLRIINDTNFRRETGAKALRLFESQFEMNEVYGAYCDKLESLAEGAAF